MGLTIVVFVVMGGAMLLAAGLHLGPSVIIAGFTAIFFTLGVGGGSLRADLRKVAWYGPLTALSASVPRLVAEHDQWLALALVCVIVFVAGLLPALGDNYAQAGLGLGIVTLLAFALQAPTGTPAQTVAAAFVGVAFVVVLRVLMKIRDPSDVTRDLVAATLTEDDPGFARAYAMWLRDRPVRWLGQCLHGSVGYRTIQPTLTSEEAATAQASAQRVAALVAAHQAADAELVTGADLPDDSSTDRRGPTYALRALRQVEQAARSRDTEVDPDAAATRRAHTVASLRSVMTWRSQILRHATRTALGVLSTFLVAWATVGPRDPLVTSMATASFAILQISWTQSLAKAKQRLLGVAGGAALMALALWILPQQWLLPFALLAAATGLWFIASNQVLSIGSFVIVSVAMNAVSRGLDPTHTLIDYVLLLFTGVALGLLLGFVVVPHLRPDPLDQRVSRAQQAVVELLRYSARSAQPATRPTHSRGAVPPAVIGPLHRVLTETANLRSPLRPVDEQTGVPTGDCIGLATWFEALSIIAVLETGRTRLTAQALTRAADTLARSGDQGAGPDADAPDFQRLADLVAASSANLLRPTPHPARRSHDR